MLHLTLGSVVSSPHTDYLKVKMRAQPSFSKILWSSSAQWLRLSMPGIKSRESGMFSELLFKISDRFTSHSRIEDGFFADERLESFSNMK